LQSAGAVSAGITLGTGALSLADDAKPPQPNVLFILADQWRSSAFGHGSDEVIETPNFDRFAQEGARFTRSYAANPVCTPNRSCLITGRYAHQHGMIQNNLMLPPGERCLAESFQSAEYDTHYIGKWHMDGVDKPGFVPAGWRRRGFQTFEGFNRGHYYPKGAKYFTDAGKLLEPDEFESAYQTDLAIDYMKTHRERPFFCYLSWGPPHTPYRAPEQYQKYDPAKLELRPNVPEAMRNNKVRQGLAGYYDLCGALDDQLGRVLAALQENQLAENTLVVFTADHGDMHGSHGLFFKGKPEDESLHVPMMMRLPGKIAAGQTPETLFNSIDVMPTLLSLAGVKDPGTCTGRDLSGAVTGGKPPEVDSVYSQGQMRAANPRRQNQQQAGANREWRSLVTRTHKLVIDAATGKVTKLFDLEHDPYELKNLAGEKSQQALEKDLFAKAQAWAKQTGDPRPQSAEPAKALYSDKDAEAVRSE
jgi:arylsulfatase A-like enzyme